MKVDIEKIKAEIAERERHDAILVKNHIQYEVLDEDGYPTEDALIVIEHWHHSDPKGWFDFIHNIWHLKSWGWSEGVTNHDFYEDEKVYRYNISTAGWSGNEEIIRSMQKNNWLWEFNWVQSRRGGHYIFELSNYEQTN